MIPIGMKTIGIAVGIVVMLVVVTGFATLSVYVNTDGISFSEKGVMGNSVAGGISEGNPMKDMLDSTSYVMAWSSGGYGEKIVVSGQVKWKDSDGAIFSPKLTNHYYKVVFDGNAPLGSILINGVQYSGNPISWESKEFDQDVSFTNKYTVTPIEGVILNVQNPFNGKIHVELWGAVDQDFGRFVGKLASDEANLKDGIGKVEISNRVVEETQDLVMYVTTGVSHSVSESNDDAGGWKMMISDPNGVTVKTYSLADNLISSKQTWTVPDGAYRSTWNNTYYVTLRNELIDQDQKFFFTIGQGMIEDIPKMPSFEKVSGDHAPYHVGDQVVIKVTSEMTTYPIASFDVWLEKVSSEGQVYDYVWKQKSFQAEDDGDGIYSAFITITFNDVGYYKMEASAVDTCPTGVLHSDVASYDFRTFDDDGSGPFDGFDWLQIALIVGAILTVIGVLFVFVPGIPTVLRSLGWVLIIIGVALLIGWGVVSSGLIKVAPAVIGVLK